MKWRNRTAQGFSQAEALGQADQKNRPESGGRKCVSAACFRTQSFRTRQTHDLEMKFGERLTSDSIGHPFQGDLIRALNPGLKPLGCSVSPFHGAFPAFSALSGRQNVSICSCQLRKKFPITRIVAKRFPIWVALQLAIVDAKWHSGQWAQGGKRQIQLVAPRVNDSQVN